MEGQLRLPVCARHFGLLLAIVVLVSCESFNRVPVGDNGPSAKVQKDQTTQEEGSWKRDAIDTTVSAEYLNESERQVIIEINMVRTDPAEYARRFLVPLRSYFQNKLMQYPGEVALLTNEGIGALDECIKELQVAKPLSALSPKEGLTRAARDHAKDQAKTGATGHTGSDNSTLPDRLNRYGTWGITAGENIDYGNGTARRIVTSLLIDDGMTSRGHRINLLNDKFKFVGVSVGPHKVYGHMCVMDFVGSYR